MARRDEGTDRGELDTAGWARRLTAGGEFTVVHVDEFRWSIDLGADGIHDLFSTFSDWSAPEVGAAAEAVRQLGGTVTEHYVTPLIVLRRHYSPSADNVHYVK
ncbi:hypothetical protein FHX82_005359 [Amycolatopsis bartoniae]|uniref:Uncharacterized protein n=1 Tax=Amycolatopsis bartoniae TaxID=941986 RepID=A0A8H9M8E1_9PSEU|nr:hypothetical protein [Amycolatopsis bartoniae]MBB2938283.1 hypothetical protein [Amycolatopsis bartoniae]TVT09053.1 hypothetical protein FNH07_10485 [Amycolatopsis bartoniae]GHF34016.1 hypothetical protein GCM10017566_03370 [Amycolatopsis bartoniae]